MVDYILAWFDEGELSEEEILLDWLLNPVLD